MADSRSPFSGVSALFVATLLLWTAGCAGSPTEAVLTADLPLYLGFGIASATQARSACESADGVIIGSALIKLARSTEAGKAPEKIEAFLREVRIAIDKAADSATAIENKERTE